MNITAINSNIRGFSGGTVVKNLHANVGDTRDRGLISGLGRSPGGGTGNPLQHSCLEIPWTEKPGGFRVHRVTKSQTQLSTHARG